MLLVVLRSTLAFGKFIYNKQDVLKILTLLIYEKYMDSIEQNNVINLTKNLFYSIFLFKITHFYLHLLNTSFDNDKTEIIHNN